MAVLFLAAACGGPIAPARDPLAGVYRIGGGDAALPNVQALTDSFTAKHPGVKFQFDTSLGSDGGVNLSADHTFDLGMASRELTLPEIDLVDHVLVGVAGTGLVIHQSNPLKDLTTAQVQAIYSGKMTDWSALGQVKLPIIPLVREKGSSARGPRSRRIFMVGSRRTGRGFLRSRVASRSAKRWLGRPGRSGWSA